MLFIFGDFWLIYFWLNVAKCNEIEDKMTCVKGVRSDVKGVRRVNVKYQSN